ncbi:MAG: hypothetical protein AAF571_01160 [Verrucomicrobiota bacterium]
MVTQDVDVALDMSPENLKRLYNSLKDLHLRHRVGMNKRPFEARDTNDPNWENLYLMSDLGQLDCLGEVKGVGRFDAVRSRSKLIEFEKCKFRLINMDALIDAKAAVGRPKDIHAVRELEAIQKSPASDDDD